MTDSSRSSRGNRGMLALALSMCAVCLAAVAMMIFPIPVPNLFALGQPEPTPTVRATHPPLLQVPVAEDLGWGSPTDVTSTVAPVRAGDPNLDGLRCGNYLSMVDGVAAARFSAPKGSGTAVVVTQAPASAQAWADRVVGELHGCTTTSSGRHWGTPSGIERADSETTSIRRWTHPWTDAAGRPWISYRVVVMTPGFVEAASFDAPQAATDMDTVVSAFVQRTLTRLR